MVLVESLSAVIKPSDMYMPLHMIFESFMQFYFWFFAAQMQFLYCATHFSIVCHLIVLFFRTFPSACSLSNYPSLVKTTAPMARLWLAQWQTRRPYGFGEVGHTARKLARVWRHGPHGPRAFEHRAARGRLHRLTHHRLVQADAAAARSAGGTRWARTRTKSLTSRCAASFQRPPISEPSTRSRSGPPKLSPGGRLACAARQTAAWCHPARGAGFWLATLPRVRALDHANPW